VPELRVAPFCKIKFVVDISMSPAVPILAAVLIEFPSKSVVPSILSLTLPPSPDSKAVANKLKSLKLVSLSSINKAKVGCCDFNITGFAVSTYRAI
jgi:hypothetical protein